MFYAVDTNFLLQCREPASLPWRDLDADELVTILVTRVVMQEVARLKQDGNGRRAKRARAAATVLRRAALADGERLELRKADPRVELRLAPPLNPNRAKASTLDLDHADDRLVEEVLAFRATTTEKVRLLSHDTGVILTAKHQSLPCDVIPDEWLLPPEPDPRDKEVQALKARLTTIEDSRPRLDLTWTGPGRDAGTLIVERIDPGELSEAAVGRLVALAETRRSDAKVAGNQSALDGIIGQPGMKAFEPLLEVRRKLTAPSAEQVRDYETELAQWPGALRAFLRRLGATLVAREPGADLTVTVANVGGAPVENLTVEFECRGRLGFAPPPPKGAPGSVTLAAPRPPKPPRSQMAAFLEGASSSPAFALNPAGFDPLASLRRAEDPQAFRRLGSRQDQRWRWACAEFRHQGDPKSFSLPIAPLRDGEDGDAASSGGAVWCRVSGSNLAEPLEIVVPVRLVSKPMHLEGEAERLVREIRPK